MDDGPIICLARLASHHSSEASVLLSLSPRVLRWSLCAFYFCVLTRLALFDTLSAPSFHRTQGQLVDAHAEILALKAEMGLL